jgi:hypothetical protein
MIAITVLVTLLDVEFKEINKKEYYEKKKRNNEKYKILK